MNTTEWKTLTEEAFPKTSEEVYIAYVNGGTIAYRSNNAYIIAIDREHMPETCDNIWEPIMGMDDGRYVIRVFYAEHIVFTNPETGIIEYEEKTFYSTDGMSIPIDHPDMKYCKYKRLETESLLS